MGYNHDIFCSPIDDNFICAICTEVFKDPVVLSCDHTFCRECIQAWFRNRNDCPNDRRVLTAAEKENLSPANRVVVNFIKGLKVKCDYRPNGCREVLTLENRDAHVQRCPYNPGRPENLPISASEVLDVIHQTHATTGNEIKRLNNEVEQLKVAMTRMQDAHLKEITDLRNAVQQYMQDFGNNAGQRAPALVNQNKSQMQILVAQILKNGYIKTRRVEKIMEDVNRAEFVDTDPYMDKEITTTAPPFAYIRAPHQHAIILELLSEVLKPGARVLEIGCGTGYLTTCFSLMVGEKGMVHSVDNNPRYVHTCIANITKSNANIIESKATHVFCRKYNNLDYANEYFDVVYCDNVFSDITYDDKLRFLRKGGVMLTIDGYDHVYRYHKKANGSVETTLIEMRNTMQCE